MPVEGNSNNNNRLPLGASKTGGCEPTRIVKVREGCGDPESGVCIFILGTYPQIVYSLIA